MNGIHEAVGSIPISSTNSFSSFYAVKYPRFSKTFADEDGNLDVTPTTVHLDIAQEIEDYSLKVGMMVIGV